MWWSTRCIRSDPRWISGREPIARPRARAAGLRSGAAQVGENPVDHSGLSNEGDDAHLVSAAGTPERVDLKDPAQQLRPAAAGFLEGGRHGLDFHG